MTVPQRILFIVKRLLRTIMARTVRVMWLRRIVAAFTHRMPVLHTRLVALLPAAAVRSQPPIPNAFAPADGVEARLSVDARRVYRALQKRISDPDSA